MDPAPPAASPASNEAPPGKKGLLATRGRKIVAAVGAAFLAGIGGGIAAWVLSAAESVAGEAFGGPPLQVRVAPAGTFASGHPYAPYYVLPRARIAGPSALPDRETRVENFFDHEWAEKRGGLPGSPQIVRLELRGKTEEPIVVNAIRVNVVRSTAPIRGWYVAQPGCGAEPVRLVDVDLDASPPSVRYVDEKFRERKRLAFSVTRTDVELIELHASTERATVEWRAEVLFSGPDGQESLEIDDGGRPFRVTTETESEGYTPASDGRRASVRRAKSWDKQGITAC